MEPIHDKISDIYGSVRSDSECFGKKTWNKE